jgi:hypothetical protein
VGKKGAAEHREKPRRDNAKFHLAITTGGWVVEGLLTGGEVNDITVAAELCEDISAVTYWRIGAMTATGFGTF